ncbi:MAG TPA: homoserine dehydrogenase [Elusimicrobia bacterium]|nr:MAG: hypothetical protein A2278_09450 [Elusimicrobia bacterium RIFOXYA12_FULL_49_49]OGS15003.1 MAG: hypothetical protein A2251_08305 [Elusimicrobia bacterium RIFOXYA2_FULL_47_53]OGS26062.1 MAG: hypothetical protein A2339_01970 [Elusimicrobia bacterium RIFOXYB12_FULL_50_12]OGS29347.1 MAG: hypothetical protein A2323_04235 [Elusimicrobia bacterium RIFOXYB2_FULL_46_23]HBU70294.1 homoserine dehydrogenase [Elusimicrobiota bacterium]
MKKSIKLGLVGYGTVGQGVAKILRKNKSYIEHKIGASVEIAGVCDLRKPRLDSGYCCADYKQLIADPEIDIIVELIGGYEPARSLILEALNAGKNVITANKAVLAKYWDEIFKTASKNQRLVYFEASVGGGIPVVQALNEGLAANQIQKISGILNGTTNYILTEMTKQKIDFKSALAKAQKAGFAEANPTFDIEGIDTAHKLAILCSLAWSRWVKLDDISISGISKVTAEDINFAKDEFGYVMKLLGSAKLSKQGLEVSVEPCLISGSHPFANVEQEYNAVLIRGDAVGDVMFYGKGAGQLPAASAVVSDIIDLAKQVAVDTAGKLPYVKYGFSKRIKIVPQEQSYGCFYLRFSAIDKPGVLSTVSGILSRCGVSIASVYQKEPLSGSRRGASIVMLTHRIKYGGLLRALRQIDALPVIKSKTVKFRIKD